jgi:hypothetical protein
MPPTTVKFHADIFLPPVMEAECLTYLVRRDGAYTITEHAAARLAERNIRLPERLPLQTGRVVEATFESGRLRRFLYRFPHPRNPKLDLVVSYDVEGRVPTAYINRAKYHHPNIERSQYATTLTALRAA